MKETKFFLCKHCGNLVGMIHNAGVSMLCCGEKMHELVANSVDASGEKHKPVAKVEGNQVKVCVGEVMHPMTAEHSIQWVYLLTDKGGQRKNLSVDDAPEVSFLLDGEKALAVYAYCDLHGLWKTDLA